MSETLEFTWIDRRLVERACAVMDIAKRKKIGLVTAESCTGGLIAAVLSEAPGAGDWLHGGFVTYTKAHKTAALGVSAELIEQHKVVSETVARAMAEGALARSPAQASVAVTGVAGPKPDEDGTAVGIVHFAVAHRGRPTIHLAKHYGEMGRGPCRYAAVEDALALLRKAMDS